MNNEGSLLTGMSVPELEALAEGVLGPPAQDRLDNLLRRNADGRLEGEELRELDHLVSIVDQLTILKTRARYTLSKGQSETVSR